MKGMEQVQDEKPSKTKRGLPNPEEMLSFYESQGLEARAASLKAIEDLQSLLRRSAAASSRRDHLSPAVSGDLQRKLDITNTRLAVLGLKLDSKPGFPESFAIAIASGTLLSALPPLLRSLFETWRSATSSPTPPP